MWRWFALQIAVRLGNDLNCLGRSSQKQIQHTEASGLSFTTVTVSQYVKQVGRPFWKTETRTQQIKLSVIHTFQRHCMTLNCFIMRVTNKTNRQMSNYVLVSEAYDVHYIVNCKTMPLFRVGLYHSLLWKATISIALQHWVTKAALASVQWCWMAFSGIVVQNGVVWHWMPLKYFGNAIRHQLWHCGTVALW